MILNYNRKVLSVQAWCEKEEYLLTGMEKYIEVMLKLSNSHTVVFR